MAELSVFWDRLADRYAAQPIADEAAYQTKLAVTRRYFRPDSEVLEFGCGTGSTAIAHAPFVGHITAIDFSPRMVAIACDKAETAGVGNVRFERADIGGFPAHDAAYDVVMGHSILHLLADPRDAMARVFRMLKPGGVFVSSTACLGDTAMAVIKYLAPIGRPLGLLPQLSVMTTGKLVADLVATGFTIDHQWSPGRGKAVFIVARKPGPVA